jgi:hypothetical protein
VRSLGTEVLALRSMGYAQQVTYDYDRTTNDVKKVANVGMFKDTFPMNKVIHLKNIVLLAN